MHFSRRSLARLRRDAGPRVTVKVVNNFDRIFAGDFAGNTTA